MIWIWTSSNNTFSHDLEGIHICREAGMKSFFVVNFLYIFSWFGGPTYMQRGWHESAKLGSRRNANVKRGVKYITFIIIYHIPYMLNISLSSSAWFTNHHHHHHHLCCYHHNAHRHPGWLQICTVWGWQSFRSVSPSCKTTWGLSSTQYWLFDFWLSDIIYLLLNRVKVLSVANSQRKVDENAQIFMYL